MGHLSQEQKDMFIKDGFIIVRDLLDAERINTGLELLKKYTSIVPDDPNTWPEGVYDWLPVRDNRCDWDDDAVISPEIQEIIGELTDPQVRLPRFSPALRFPQPGPKIHEIKGIHIDAKFRGITPYPSEFHILIFGYLTDTLNPYDAPFTAFPGSQRKVFEYSQLPGVDIGEEYKPANARIPGFPYGDPVPVTGRAGDIIFAHFLLAHSASINRSNRVRVGLRGEAKARDHKYVPKMGAPQADWTPLDWTLRTDNLSVS